MEHLHEAPRVIFGSIQAQNPLTILHSSRIPMEYSYLEKCPDREIISCICPKMQHPTANMDPFMLINECTADIGGYHDWLAINTLRIQSHICAIALTVLDLNDL